MADGLWKNCLRTDSSSYLKWLILVNLCVHNFSTCTQQMPPTRLDQKLSGLSETINDEQYIFRVHDRLRRQNYQAYEPEMLAIGPYHHGKSNLKNMESYKLRCLQGLLLRRGEASAERYFIALTELEDQARRCYAEEISLSKEDFVEMMCLDGCFIIEFLRKCDEPELRGRDDLIFQLDWLHLSVARDLMLFENQLPFFILVQLFDMTECPGREKSLNDVAILNLTDILLLDCENTINWTGLSVDGVIHLLDLLHKRWCSSFAATLGETQDPEENFPFEFIKSTCELQIRGIKFEKAEISNSWLHITFENGVLKIPRLTVGDITESLFRNLIAYEEYMLKSGTGSWRCVSDYAVFMDCLIDSSKDVEKLRHRHIIRNWLGHDAAVSTMFNRIGNDVNINLDEFCYLRLCKEVNEHSSRRPIIWFAHLRKNYFNTPWSIIKFLAAFMLLLFTAAQTVFSFLQYFKKEVQ